MDGGACLMFGRFFRFAMSDKQAHRWETAREREFLRHVLMTGVLYWGGLMFVFSTCLETYPWHEHLNVAFFAKKALTWGLSGCFFGLLTSGADESRYRAYRKESASHSTLSL
jgi:hypothetical protein